MILCNTTSINFKVTENNFLFFKVNWPNELSVEVTCSVVVPNPFMARSFFSLGRASFVVNFAIGSREIKKVIIRVYISVEGYN